MNVRMSSVVYLRTRSIRRPKEKLIYGVSLCRSKGRRSSILSRGRVGLLLNFLKRFRHIHSSTHLTELRGHNDQASALVNSKFYLRSLTPTPLIYVIGFLAREIKQESPSKIQIQLHMLRFLLPEVFGLKEDKYK